MNGEREGGVVETVNGMSRLHVAVEGVVQGIGFRPRIYSLATGLGLGGWVRNTLEGIALEVEGTTAGLEEFVGQLWESLPQGTTAVRTRVLDPELNRPPTFEIRPSTEPEPGWAGMPPDVATCTECLREVLDPSNRRFRYPFTTCSRCGPRYSLIETMPYDRERTVMRAFPLCAACRSEYRNPADRRFHAQGITCAECGPTLEWWDADGTPVGSREQAIQAACDHLRQGGIVAVKGIGGFQLMVDARNGSAVRRLRQQKARTAKPFAVMFTDLAAVREVCQVSPEEAALLESPEAPIVLLERRPDPPVHAPLADDVAPGGSLVGAMLPCSPLHHLLVRDLGIPVVATSGNLSEEPLCFDEGEVVTRLGGIADGFLVHDRPIRRPVDDSVVHWMAGQRQVLRRARGLVPLPLKLPRGPGDQHVAAVLALGTHQKNAIGLAVGNHVYLSPHLGDLDSPAARTGFEQAVGEFSLGFGLPVPWCVIDRHPDYYPSQYAERHFRSASGPEVLPVSHHAAHILSCMAEHELQGPLLGIAWDGTGLGPDGTLWGGEFLEVTSSGIHRVAHWRSFPLPGGELAVEEPRRSALGLLWELYGSNGLRDLDVAALRAFTPGERDILIHLLERGVQCSRTTSVGRLFDAVASLVGLRQKSRFEGDAAMALESACQGQKSDDAYPVSTDEGAIDWAPWMRAMLEDARKGVPVGGIAVRFHETLASSVVAVAQRVGHIPVVLSGGCFQNRRLTERVVQRLRTAGFVPYWHERVPPNDGGIAVGQAYAFRLGWAGKV